MATTTTNADDQKQEQVVAQMKLMVNKRNNSIAYAEADKGTIDALASFLLLPAGAIAKHSLSAASAKTATGPRSSIENLYRSIEKLPDSLIKSGKSELLDPKAVSTAYANTLLGVGPPQAQAPSAKRYYTCGSVSSYYNHSVTTSYGSVDCACGNSLTRELKMVEPLQSQQAQKPTGFVRKATTFVITDDLHLFPLTSTAEMLQLWATLGIRDPSELHQRPVNLTAGQLMGLLKASLSSSTALNDVFKETSKPKTLDLDIDKAALQEILAKLFGDALLKPAKSAALKS